MGSEFKPGDTVTCVDDHAVDLVLGRDYVVRMVDIHYVHLVEVTSGGFYPRRFKLSKRPLITKAINEFQTR